MKEYNFEAVWVHTISGETNEIEISVFAIDEQTAREMAFERCMTIHKNMCQSKADFHKVWHYSGLHLMYVVPA